MSPAWTIVMEQAFNVANDHCCRSPRFTHGCLPYQFYGVSPSFSPFSLSLLFLSPTHANPSNHHRFHLFLLLPRTRFKFHPPLRPSYSWLSRFNTISMVASATTSPLYRCISVVQEGAVVVWG